MKNFFKSHWLILSIVFLGAVIRFIYAYAPATQISPDESTYGLAALHWMKGTGFPIFYYAQPYTGTASAIISAGLMAVFGAHPFWLKIIPLLCSVIFIYTNYLLGKKIFKKESVGLIAALLTALASPFFLNWSSRAGTGYPEMVLVGNVILLLVIKRVYGGGFCEASIQGNGGPERPLQMAVTAPYARWRRFFILGFLVGLGIWVQPAIVYYALPALFLLWLWKPWLPVTISGWTLVLGVMVGAGPVIYYNLTHDAVTVTTLFHDPWGVRRAATTFWTVGFPIITGLRASWSTIDFFLPLSVLSYLLYISAASMSLISLMGHLLWEETVGMAVAWGRRLFKFVSSVAALFMAYCKRCYRGRVSRPHPPASASRRSKWRAGKSGRYNFGSGISLWSQEVTRLISPAWLVWGVLGTTWVVFSLSGQFGQFVIEPRYILSLYTVLPLLMGWFLAKIPVPHRLVRIVLVMLVVLSQTIGIFIGGKNTRPATFLAQYPLDGLVSFLKQHEIGYVYSDEDICHRLIFESNERIICTPITDSFTTNRYPAYKEMVVTAPKEQVAYVRVPGKTYHLQECLDDLSVQEDPCRFEEVNGFGVYFYR